MGVKKITREKKRLMQEAAALPDVQQSRSGSSGYTGGLFAPDWEAEA